MVRSNQEWRYWGKVDPLWAVSTQPGREAGSSTAWTSAAFLAEGAEYFAPVLRQWRAYGMGHDHCLEIGCGAGRLTAQLLNAFDRVTGLDVSPEQLRLATVHMGEASTRASFLLVDEPVVPLPTESCDAMYSAEVFQHFSSYGLIESYLHETYRVLLPEGTLCLNIPVLGVQESGRLWYALRRARTALERAAGRRRLMDYRIYPAKRVLRTLESIGFRDTELRAFHVGAHRHHHAYFFARK